MCTSATSVPPQSPCMSGSRLSQRRFEQYAWSQDVQENIIGSIPGLEHPKMARPAYGVGYC